MASDLEDQKRETFWVFDDLRSKKTLPEMAIVDFQFIPDSGNGDASGSMTEINDLDYKADLYESDNSVQISTRPIVLGAERIWFHEELFTVIARKYGFAPDGWGFFGVEKDGAPASQ